MSSEPRLSVVVVTRDRLWVLRPTLAALRAQTIADRIELLVVAPTTEVLDDAPEWLEAFQRVEAVAVGPIQEVDAASAHGLLRASAPVVASVEDHAFPEPEWAERIVEAHATGPWSVVGGHMVNANPGPLSWANVLISHLPEVERTEGEVHEPITTHNATYSTAALAPYGEGLGAMMGRGGGLMRDLLDNGHRIHVTPAARYRHLQVTRPLPLVRYRFDSGRNAAATRARTGRWSRRAQLARVAAGPLLPLVLFARRAVVARRMGLPARTLGPLALCAALEGAGEVAGYARGPGGTGRRLAEVETDRRRMLSRRDRVRYDAAVDHPAA